MKFIVDAQLPRRIVAWLENAGCEAMHTFDLPAGNRSTDEQILGVTEADQRIFVTKDSDFVDSHLISGRPAKLFLISTGNVSNRELEQLMAPMIPTAIREFQTDAFVELDRTGLIIRG